MPMEQEWQVTRRVAAASENPYVKAIDLRVWYHESVRPDVWVINEIDVSVISLSNYKILIRNRQMTARYCSKLPRRYFTKAVLEIISIGSGEIGTLILSWINFDPNYPCSKSLTILPTSLRNTALTLPLPGRIFRKLCQHYNHWYPRPCFNTWPFDQHRYQSFLPVRV